MKGAMKKTFTTSSSGSVLLATMIFVLAIAAFLATYLYFVQNSNLGVARSQQWNSALAIAEAGIEEGLANINQTAITTNPTNGGFGGVLSRNLNGGTYAVSDAAAGVVHTLTSRGSVRSPILGQTITRIVQVRAQRQGLFSKGMIAMTFIRMNGNGVISDSFDSHDPLQSDNGAYDSTIYSGTNGDIAAVTGIVNLGNHTIGGDLFLGTEAVFERGNVLGTIYTDWNMTFPDALLPAQDADGNTIAWTPAPGDATAHTFTTSGHYIISDNGSIIVNPGVQVTLDIRQTSYNPSGLNIQGGATNAGTVIMYQGSGSLNLGGNASGGAINNRPENFVYYGLPNVTSITLGGSSTFVGVIYAPQANMTLNGGGSGMNYSGSLIVKSVTVNGHYYLHYDTSLAGYYYGYYVAGSWRELFEN
jgi:hypothetical protein